MCNKINELGLLFLCVDGFMMSFLYKCIKTSSSAFLCIGVWALILAQNVEDTQNRETRARARAHTHNTRSKYFERKCIRA